MCQSDRHHRLLRNQGGTVVYATRVVRDEGGWSQEEKLCAQVPSSSSEARRVETVRQPVGGRHGIRGMLKWEGAAHQVQAPPPVFASALAHYVLEVMRFLCGAE